MLVISIFIFQLLLFIILVFQLVLTIFYNSKKNATLNDDLLKCNFQVLKEIENNKRLLDESFEKNRLVIETSAKNAREELNTTFLNFTKLIEEKLFNLQSQNNTNYKDMREELANSLSSFESKFSGRVSEFGLLQKAKFDELKIEQSKLTDETLKTLDKIRTTIEAKLIEIQKDNTEKLEKMRETVDEKLHNTLENRLNASFNLVSERLLEVQKGLGEMQTLASGVGDLKKVLSNVKTKGVLGEYQLGAILDEILTSSQYAKNVKTKTNSNDIVEYAIKIPSKEMENKYVWIPLDAKFPTEDYSSLMEAYDEGDIKKIEKSKKDLERRIKDFAKDINEKYIEVPNTTDFAIMFLPVEGLYAEVLRIVGLFETVQREFKVTITGPTTISAFLNSLNMGFRTLAVEKRSSEVWQTLAAVRTEFNKFGLVLENTKKKIDAASKEIDSMGVRSRAIERKLKNVEVLPENEASELLSL